MSDNLKVYIAPQLEDAPYGIARLVEAMYKYLPQYGITPVKRVEDADVVNVHAMALVETDKPIVYTSHGLYWEEDSWPVEWRRANAQMIDYMLQADAITAVSDWVAHALARGMMRYPVAIPHGVDSDVWEPGESKGYVLWNKARHDPVSDPAAMQRVASMLPSVGFVTTFGETTGNVQVTGAVDHDVMHDMVQQAGVYLSTTYETFGIGTLEALACGVPVVGWDIGGNREIIQNGVNGYLVPFGDYDQLAEKIQLALNDIPMRGQCRETAVDEWGWELRIKKYADTFRDVVFWRKSRAHFPKVSVIITAHNLDKYLLDCLLSVEAQPYTNYEVLVIDDVSTDKTNEIAHDFCSERPNWFCIKTPHNLLTAGARNFGMTWAQGEYYIFLDADDMLAEDALTPLVDALDHNRGLSIAYGHLDTISEDGENRRRNNWPFDRFNFLNQIAHLNQIPYCAMFRSEIGVLSSGYRTRDKWTEDALFWTHCTSFGSRAEKVTEQPVLLYRLREQSKSRSDEARNVGWTSWFPWKLAVTPEEGARLRGLDVRPPEYIVPFGAQVRRNSGAAYPVWRHDEPTISVVIPVGPGHGKYLIDAVDSVQAQSFPWWECVVVDNTMTDELDRVMLPAWVKRVRNDTPSIAISRNKGFGITKAPLIIFLDADDILSPNCMVDLLTAYVESNGRYAYGDWVAISETKTKKESSKDYSQLAWGKTGLHPITCLIPREWIKEVGGFDHDLPGWEDWDFFIKLAISGYCGVRVESTTMGYRLHGGQRREQSLLDASETLPILKERYSDYFEGRKNMPGCCGGNGTTIIHAKKKLGLLPKDEPIRSNAMGNDLVRIKSTADARGAKTHYRVMGIELQQPVKLGASPVNRYANVPAADADLLVKAGYASRVNSPEIDMHIASTPKPDIPASARALEAVVSELEALNSMSAQQAAAVSAQAAAVSADLDPPASSGENDYDLLAEGTIIEIRTAVTGWEAPALRELLKAEQRGKNRKSCVKMLTTFLQDAERVG